MTKEQEEELIKQAKEKYPIGSVVKSAHSYEQFTIDSDNFHIHDEDGVRLRQNPSWNWWIKLAHGGQWAEIISSPKPKEVNFSIF